MPYCIIAAVQNRFEKTFETNLDGLLCAEKSSMLTLSTYVFYGTHFHLYLLFYSTST